MNAADQLLEGYTAYTTAEEFGVAAESDAPAITTTVTSSEICVSLISASVTATWDSGC
ncbi:LxmA leader domain family RiPP [Streptomyces sp. NPDC006700]|uniref:LxmA leader domain family RiPP n=1 Tax=Streptomyces sp. NPDC006700 TaxID=3154479 RepID=UPI0033D5F625